MKRRVLVVDDKVENRYFLNVLLQGHDYEVFLAADGAEALDLAGRNVPDLIVSDLLMPVMDGYTLLSQWKADERFKAIPFVVYTATYTDANDERLARDLGADDFMLKPMDPDLFVARIQAVLAKAKQGGFSSVRPPLAERETLLKEYSEVLIRKLEEKAIRLEEARRKLEQDVILRRQSEEALQESEGRFQSLVETAPEAIFVQSEGRFVYLNRAALELFGAAKAEELLGAELMARVAPEYRDTVRERIRLQCLTGQAAPLMDQAYLCLDGSRIPVETTAMPIRFQGREAHLVFARDVTERKQAEEALRKSKLLLSEVGRIAKIGGWEMDLINRTATWTQTTYDIVEIEPGEPIPGPDEHLSYYLPEFRGRVAEAMKTLIEKNQPLNFEAPLRTAKGNVKWCQAIGMAAWREGRCVKIYGTFQDITDRKKAEALILLSAQRSLGLLELYERAALLTEKELLTFGVDLAARLTCSAVAFIHFVNRDQQTLHLTAWSTETLKTCRAVYDAHYPIDKAGIWADAVRQRKPVVHNDYPVRTDRKGYPEGHSPIARELVVPVLEGDQVRMVVGVGNKPDDYNDEDVTHLQLVANTLWKLLERRVSERRQALLTKVLAALNDPDETMQLVRTLLALLKEDTGIEAVGVRLREGEDFPYYEANGFPRHFLEVERYLCARDREGRALRDEAGRPLLECMCGNILRGRTDPSKLFFTAGGSFWTNGTTSLLASASAGDQLTKLRNHCNKAGYESVALVPLRSGREIVGLLQLNDKRPGLFSADLIRFFEEIASGIGIAIARRKAHEALQKSEKRLDALNREWQATFDAMSDVVWLLGPDCRILRCNRASQKVFGRPEEEVLGRKCWEIMHGLDSPISACPLLRLKESGRCEAEEMVVGSRWFNVSVDPIQGEDGTLEGAVHVVRDISERKWEATVQRETEEKFKYFFEAANVGKSITLPTGEINVNRAFAEMLGYEPEELKNRTWRELTPPDEVAVTQAIIDSLLRGEKDCDRFTKQYLHKNGAPIWADVSVKMRRDGEGKPLYFITTVVDVTARKKMEEELRQHRENLEELVEERTKALKATNKALEEEIAARQRTEELLAGAKDEAERANRAKSTFLSSMSHEIRTPMNAILGFSQLMLQDPDLSSRQRERLETVVRSGEHLLAIINEILEFSKIEAGRIVLNPDQFDVQAMLGELEQMFRLKTEANGVSLRFEPLAGLPRFLVADAGKLRQILINLIGNAVKFTETGAVVLHMRGEKKEGGNILLIAEIRDSGSGISEQDQKNLFQAFSQTENGVRKGGTGLGLALSRQYARLMGGDIVVESEMSKGSCFTATIEAEEGELLAAPDALLTRSVLRLRPDQAPPRLLVVDDAADNRKLLREMLVSVGFELQEAANGKEALEKFQAWAPQAILMDLRMPVMDGREAIRCIRTAAGGANVPIIAITASAFDEDKKRALESGADAYLRKPFRMEELYECLSTVLGVEYLYRDETASAADKASPSPKEPFLDLPQALLNRMIEATINLDQDLLLELLNQAVGAPPDLVKRFRMLAKGYRYDELLTALRQGNR